jgi:hypothetical protein
MVRAGHVGVEGHDLDTGCLRLSKRRAKSRRVVSCDHDRISFGLDSRLDRRNLSSRGVGRATADDDFATEFGERGRATLVGDDLIRVLRVLRDEVDGQSLLDVRRSSGDGRGRRRRGSRRGCGGRSGRRRGSCRRRRSCSGGRRRGRGCRRGRLLGTATPRSQRHERYRERHRAEAASSRTVDHCDLLCGGCSWTVESLLVDSQGYSGGILHRSAKCGVRLVLELAAGCWRRWGE